MQKQVATYVVTRLRHQSDNPPVKLPTVGQHISFIKVSASLAPSGKCIKDAVRKRTNVIKAVKEMLSMGDC
uniref:Uncharacterized protein n=1 Tax=Amphimedon queenslandica TaxID=400682 RepID=A0A1X7VUC6_AMPQE